VAKLVKEVTMFCPKTDLKSGLHHPYITFDKDALQNGVDILTEICIESLTK